MKIRFAGRVYDLDRPKVISKLRDVEPEPGRRFFVNINGEEFPIKQAVAAAIDRPVMEIGTNTAYSALRRLGFEIIDVVGGDGK